MERETGKVFAQLKGKAETEKVNSQVWAALNRVKCWAWWLSGDLLAKNVQLIKTDAPANLFCEYLACNSHTYLPSSCEDAHHPSQSCLEKSNASWF